MELQDIQSIYKLKKWFSRNWEFAGLSLLLALYLFLSNYFMWGPSFTNGIANFSGGSDPYFNWYVITYIISHHVSLLSTSGLNYPLTSGDPRPLFFHWMIVFVAEIIGPILGGTLHAAYYVFMEFDAVFGALLIIPVYLLGKSIIGRKAGMIGAVLYTLMPSNLTSGILSDGRMHTPELIFAFFAIYFFERAITYSGKGRIIEGSLLDLKSHFSSLKTYFHKNQKSVYYSLFAGASYGALMLSWQGSAYILAILAIYVILQLLLNLFLSRNTGYVLFVTTIFVTISFIMSAYYYYGANNDPSAWFIAPLVIGLGVIFLGLIISVLGRKPWIVSIPLIIILISIFVGALAFLDHHMFSDIVTGDGYFIKSKLYSTIAEAQAPALGQYIAGFGVAQFILGLGGIGVAVYRYAKERKESYFFLLIFSLVSIYMSFEAARFNITASPAYALLGGLMLYEFARMIKISGVKDDNRTKKAFRKRAGIKGNMNWIQAVFVVVVVFGILIPSGLGVVATAVPTNSAPAVNHEIYNALPPFAKPDSYQVNVSTYFGSTGSQIVNDSSPLSMSLAWLATQQANESLANKPAYVNWWDYGFQELCQGKHPTVADDFQQAYQIAGQILLSTNESQIVSLFISRLLQENFQNNSGSYSPAMKAALSQFLSNSELVLLKNINKDPLNYKSWIMDNSSVYGTFSSSITSVNAYYALIKGQLASHITLSNLVNLYQSVQEVSGYSIQYIQVDHTLFPLSGLDTGTFYAPAYLTDTPSYVSQTGAVVPYEYYQIYVQTANGTFPLNQTPPTAVPTGYELGYTPAFYNTTIYKAMIGLPPSAVGQTNGLPGLDYGSTKYSMEPAFNMSNFEICYEGVPYNPYNNYTAHPSAFKIIPLKEAYTLQKEGKGVALIFPQLSTIIQSSDPILRYFPGAVITGQVKTPSGLPVSGVRVSIYDQYKIPHQTVVTNKNGYYNITGLPGNDTIVFSYGKLNKEYLTGANYLFGKHLFVSEQQALRQASGINMSTGLPNYYFQENLQVANTSVFGNVSVTGASTSIIHSGTLTYTNETTETQYNTSIVNGNYSFNNLPMGLYSVSVETSSQLYSNVSTVHIANNTFKQENVNVELDRVLLKVLAYGKPVPDATISINGQNFVTNSTSKAIQYLNTGQYTFKAISGNLVSKALSIEFPVLNTTRSITLNLTSGNYVNITLQNIAITGNLLLYRNGDLSAPYNLSKTGPERFTGIIPTGYYTVYDHSSGMGLFTSLNINSNLNTTLSASKVANTTIIFNAIKISDYSGIVGALDGTTALFQNSTSLSNTSLYLPMGSTYTFEAEVSKNGANYFGSRTQEVSNLGNVYLQTADAGIVQVGVYNPSISSVLNANSEVHSGIAFFNLSGSSYSFSLITLGYAKLYFPSTSINGVSMFAFAHGSYAKLNSVTASSTVPIVITTHRVTLHFVAKAVSSGLNGEIALFGIGDYRANIVNGYANVTLAYGSYVLQATGGNMFLNNYTPLIHVASGISTVTVYYYPLVSLSVTNVKNAVFYYTNGTAIQYDGYLAPGNYTVYSVNGALSSIQQVYVTENYTLAATLHESYTLTILNTMKGKNEFYFTYNGLSISTSGNSILLPVGNYVVKSVDYLYNSTSQFLLTGSKSLVLSADESLFLPITNSTYLTTVNGVISNNLGLSNAAYNIELYRDGKLAYSNVSDGNGVFTLHVNVGNYTYYAFSDQYMMAQTGLLKVNHFQKNSNLAVLVTKAHYISLSTTVNGKASSITVNVTRNSQLLMEKSNGNSILLPSSNYTFSAYISKSTTVNGFNTYYAYSYSITTTTYANKNVQLNLQRVLIGNVTLKQNAVSSAKEYAPVTYTITLQNHLNNNETFTLSSGSSAWQEKFTNSSSGVVLINGSFRTSVTFNNTQLVPMGINKVPINVSYSGGTETLYMKVNITKAQGYSVSSLYNVPSYVNNTAVYYLKFTNNGNVNETISLNISNFANLNSLLHWNATFMYKGKTIGNITLNFSQAKTVEVVLTPITSAAALKNVPVDVESVLLQSQETPKWVNLTFTPQGAPSVSGHPVGVGIISNYVENPFLPIEYGLIIIAVAVVGGFATMALRGRRKK